METTMKSLLLLLLIGSTVAVDPKIVGGSETTIEDVPYQLELENAILGVIWSFSCGAVIVGENQVLTAGHCISKVKQENLRFRSGSANRGKGVIHKIESMVLHPDYIENQVSDNDIAFITVTPPFTFDETTQPINITTVQPSTGDNATVSGWGLTSETSESPPNVIRKVVIPIVDREICTKDYVDLTEISDAMICAGLQEGGKDSCSGDSGGPMLVNGALAGLVSWGYGCAQAGSPGVYTNVAHFASWIQEQMAASRKQ